MELGKDFYVFEVLEYYEDKLICFDTPNKFYEGERFIGWETSYGKAIKSNMEETICIPLKNVKKVFKINFEDVQ